MKQIARLTLFTPARSDLLRFRGHFGHELGRGLRAQQLLLRELGSACCSPRFLLPLLVFSALVKQWHVQSNLLGDFEHLRALFHGLNLQKDEARGRTHRERGGTCEYLRARGVHLGTNRMQLLNVSWRSSKLQQHNQCVTRLHILAINLTVSDTCCMPRKSAMLERVCGAR